MMSRSSAIPMLVLSLSGLLGGSISLWVLDRGSQATETTVGRAQDAPVVKGWQKGKGWGWIWGKDDEVGALNAITDRESSRRLEGRDSGRGLRPGHDLQPAELQVARS